MFTPADRAALRDQLVSAARQDPRITAIALTGSSATGGEDAWSDIDLAFALAPHADRSAVLQDWTERLYGEHQAVHHTDLRTGMGLFRAFLLPSTLQVDLAFWPEDSFGAMGPAFHLLSGEARPQPASAPVSADTLVGLGWLFAVHARTCIARGQRWQAEYMISGLRDQVLALACLRHQLPTVHGRGFERLPTAVTDPLRGALVRSLTASDLIQAFQVAVAGFIRELEASSGDLAARLGPPLNALNAIAPPGPL